jgi:hypothetical protein
MSGIWTAQQLAGGVLVTSAFFVLGVSGYTRVRDKGGPMIFGQPPHEWLRLVHQHPRLWHWATVSFIGAILTTRCGLVLLARLLTAAGDPGFAAVGLLAFALGTVLWVIILSARLTVDPWAGSELVANGAIPDVYTVVSRWNGFMFILFTILAFGGTIAFGGAVLATTLLPHWLGWATILYSAAGLVILAITRDSIPAMHHLMPLAFGIALLLL